MIIKGNIISLAESGLFDVIIHGCNCFHTMGAGIAKEIATKYPEAYSVDKQYTTKGDKTKLGGYTHVQVTSANGHKFTIINAYTQYYYGRPKKNSEPLVDYTAVGSVFSLIRCNFGHLRLGYPKIGAGLAGGDWNTIKNIIDTILHGTDHKLVTL